MRDLEAKDDDVLSVGRSQRTSKFESLEIIEGAQHFESKIMGDAFLDDESLKLVVNSLPSII